MAGIPAHSFGAAATIVVLRAATTVVVRVRVGNSETHRNPCLLVSVHSIRPTKNTHVPPTKLSPSLQQNPSTKPHSGLQQTPANRATTVNSPAPSHPVLSCFITSYHALFHPAPFCHVTSRHITSHHIILRPIPSRPIPSRHALSHYVPSRSVTSQTKYFLSRGGSLE